MPGSHNCACPVMRSKKKRDGGTRSCSGRLRPSTRGRSSSPLASHVPDVDCRAFAKHEQDVFRSLRCFLDKNTCPHIAVGSRKCSRFLRPPFFCCTNINMSRASPCSLLQNTEFCQAPLSVIFGQTHSARQDDPALIQLQHVVPTFFVLLLFLPKRLTTQITFSFCFFPCFLLL